MKLTITDFDNYIKNQLPKYLLDDYQKYKIISEADLQSIVWNYLIIFVKDNHERETDFKVLNKPYLKDLKIHPDIVIFREEKPWLIMELKETKRIKLSSAQKERERLLKVRSHFKSVKRGYLLYLTRYGEGKIITGQKGAAARFFFEVPVILENYMRDNNAIKKWRCQSGSHLYS